MKSVAIIGAGPAGIIAARKLLQSGKFTITIYEQNEHIGGAWAPEGIINPDMRTNHSKFTMNFSDLSWDSLEPEGSFTPLYPKASQILGYLKSYCERYIPSKILQFRTSIQEVKQVQAEDGDSQPRWALQLKKRNQDGTTELSDIEVDYVVAAPGFFYNAPKEPPFSRPIDSPIPIIHSTQYRGLGAIEHGFATNVSGKRRVLVIGGSHSGGEIASLIALQLSNSQYSPGMSEAERTKWRNVDVVHVSPHEMHAIPAFIRDTGATQCSFQPLDFTLATRPGRPEDIRPSYTAGLGLVTPDKVAFARSFVRNIMDDNEGTITSREEEELIPAGVLGDNYAQFIKTGQITQLRGRLLELLPEQDGSTLAATVASSQGEETLQNVCAVVYATGFDVTSSFSFLAAETKDAMKFDPKCHEAPLVLDKSSLTQNRAVPTLAVAGFAGAYWPLFEQQARAIVREWTALPGPPAKAQQEQHTQLLKYYQDLRAAVKEGRKAEVPRNTFGDGGGIFEEGSRELELERLDLGFPETESFMCSARFVEPGSDKWEPMKTLQAVQDFKTRCRGGGYLARAAFFGLLGEWVAACKTSGGGLDVVHQAFHARIPTDAASDWEYLSLRTLNGKVARYVYRYSEEHDCMTVWDTKGDGFRAGQLVGTFDFQNAGQERGKNTAVATLVPADDSNVELGESVHQFCFAGVSLKTWSTAKVEAGATTGGSFNFVRAGVAS